MKKLMLYHSIIEMVAGLVLILRPELLLMNDGQSIETIIVAKLYGILALTFGAISFLIYQIFAYTDTFKKIVLMIMFFHLMISLQMYAAYSNGTISTLGAFGLHIILAILFFGVYMNELNNFPSKITEVEH